MIVIPFPQDCTQGLEKYRFTIERYQLAISTGSDVALECGNVRFFHPMGLTLLASFAYSLDQNGRNVYFIEPSNQAVARYLSDQDFFKEFDTQGSDSNRIAAATRSTSLGLRRLEMYDESYMEQIPAWLLRNSHMPPEAIKDAILTTLPEIINNVVDHSQSKIGCYICAQAYPREKRLMLSALDLGVGFLHTLRKEYPSLQNGADAIELAIKPSITSKSQSHNRGAGLDILSGFLKNNSGKLEIISRDGHWIQHENGNLTKCTLPFQFPGTCINLTFDDQALVDRYVPGDRYD